MGSTVLEFLKTVLFSLGNTVENGIAVVQTRVYEGTCCIVACILLFALTLFGSGFIERCFQTPGIPFLKSSNATSCHASTNPQTKFIIKSYQKKLQYLMVITFGPCGLEDKRLVDFLAVQGQ